jgi:hypothetical protein
MRRQVIIEKRLLLIGLLIVLEMEEGKVVVPRGRGMGQDWKEK